METKYRDYKIALNLTNIHPHFLHQILYHVFTSSQTSKVKRSLVILIPHICWNMQILYKVKMICKIHKNPENWTFKHCPRYGITTTIITLTNATSNLPDEVFHHLYTISPACPVKWSHVIATITFISTSSMGNKRLYNLKATPFTSCV